MIEQWFKKFPERDRLFPTTSGNPPLGLLTDAHASNNPHSGVLTDAQQAELKVAIKNRRAVSVFFLVAIEELVLLEHSWA